jgi:hypothetical protein
LSSRQTNSVRLPHTASRHVTAARLSAASGALATDSIYACFCQLYCVLALLELHSARESERSVGPSPVRHHRGQAGLSVLSRSLSLEWRRALGRSSRLSLPDSAQRSRSEAAVGSNCCHLSRKRHSPPRPISPSNSLVPSPDRRPIRALSRLSDCLASTPRARRRN